MTETQSDRERTDMMRARGFLTGAEALAGWVDHTEAARAAGHDVYCYEVAVEVNETGTPTAEQLAADCRCDEPE